MVERIKVFLADKLKPKVQEGQVSTETSDTMLELTGFLENIDETAETALEILSMKTAKKLGTYFNKDEDIQEFVRENLEKMEGSISFVVKDLVENAFLHGFSGAEIVYKIMNQKVYTKKIITFSSSECSYNFEDKEFKQNSTTIPNEKLIFYYRRKAKLDKMERLINIKRIFLKLWCKYIEGFTTPLIHGQTDDVDTLSEALQNIYFKKNITTDLESKINAIKLDSGGSKEIQGAMEYIDKLIFRIFYLGGSYSAGEKSGTTANSKTNENMIEDVTDWLAEEIREVLKESYIKKIIDYNFNKVESYGYFALPTKKDTDMLYKLAMTLQVLANMGYIGLDDVNIIREKFDLPEIEENELKDMLSDDKVKELVEKMMEPKDE